jgi:hypothetical protein
VVSVTKQGHCRSAGDSVQAVADVRESRVALH